MINSISQRQLLPENLDRLAAQRMLYSTSKIVIAIQLILSVPFVIMLSTLSLFFKSAFFLEQFGRTIDISWIVTSSGILIAFLDILFLSPMIIDLKEKATKIQELFDCDVLSLKWNAILAGPKPDLEDIIHNANKYKKRVKKNDDLKDWYSKEVEKISISAARILCQRSNVKWDIDLRQKVNIFLCILTLLTFFILLTIGIKGGLNVEKFIMIVLAPCLPIFYFSIRFFLHNKKSISSLSNLKEQSDKAWNDTKNSFLPDKNLENIARRLQDAIFVNRKANPLIFDKIYKKFKSHQEELMNCSCKQMISEYKENRTWKCGEEM